jgi:selenocysteine-specific elongation factor
MYVIATAGHVDHGKSTLVRALTGMEPDRWAEERRRGMTIDLGYAWTTMPSGERVAFVDVPGHERFATNMLAGVGPVPAALLVIAADGGWAAQTDDHVCALDALQVRHGVVAVTRSDLADASAAAEIAERRLGDTSLAGSEVVVVSAATGDGVGDLRAALDRLIARLEPPDAGARVRLWIDRCFTIRGSGTVVTGTLPAGTLRTGDTVELGGRPVVMRALQCLGEPVGEVTGTARVAVNLRGVAPDEVHRGDTLLSPGAWLATGVVDVLTGSAPLPAEVMVHVGSAAVAATVRDLGHPIGQGRPAPSRAVRLHLRRALPLQVGDRLLLRDPCRRQVVSGVTVLDPAPPALRRRGAARARASALRDDTGEPNVEREVTRRRAVPVGVLRSIGVAPPQSLPEAVVEEAGWLVHRQQWDAWREQLRAAVTAPAASDILDTGVARSDLARLLGLPDTRLLDPLLMGCDDVEASGGRVRPRGTSSRLRPDVAAAVARLTTSLRERPFAAPEQAELAALGLGRSALGAAAATAAILRLPGDVVLLPDAPGRAAACLQAVTQPFTVSAARQALGTTRRVAVPLLEHLDAIGVTERLDDGLRRLQR